MSSVLAFDIGIRNLAFCIQRKTTDGIQILKWDNYDLLAGQSASTAKQSPEHCAGCSSKATYESRGVNYCVRHCPLDRPAFRDLSGNLLKRLPAAKELRNFLLSKGHSKVPKSKGDLLKVLSTLYSLPILKVKVKKAVDTELTVIHDGIRRFVLQNQAAFSQVDEILLENQPVLKNPTMKSVQILLFATLRDILQPNPPSLRLVHAKKKVEEATKGDAGYKERKQGSEDRVMKLLQTNRIEKASFWKQHLDKYTKKNDLTDAFCMCVDYLEVK